VGEEVKKGYKMTLLSLALLVLRTGHLDDSLAFYRAVGLALVEEKHGSGPAHYACQIGDVVLELYPGTTQDLIDHRSSGATMLGFNVASLDAVLAAIEQTGARILSSAKTTLWGRRAVVQDPDGRAIELNEPPLSAPS
jgi:lactoylglutathione lyase